MKPETVIEFRKPVAVIAMACTACGAEANASCDCGAPYLPMPEKIARAIKANPQGSDRAIAADAGVSHPTVAKYRPSTGNDLPVEPRIGLDGRTRRMPQHIVQEPQIGDPDSAIGYAAIRRRGFMQRAEESLRLAQCCDDLTDLVIDEEMAAAVQAVATAWNELWEKIHG